MQRLLKIGKWMMNMIFVNKLKMLYYIIMLIKYIFFGVHLYFIFISFFYIFYYWQILILHFFTILSWYFNNNQCIITQLEDKLFDETIIDIYYKCIKNNYKKKDIRKFIVPWYQRYPLYLLFTFNCLKIILFYFYKIII